MARRQKPYTPTWGGAGGEVRAAHLDGKVLGTGMEVAPETEDFLANPGRGGWVKAPAINQRADGTPSKPKPNPLESHR